MHAEGDGAAQAFAAAAAHAFSAGGPEGVAIARAFAVAIGIYSCPGVKPVLTCELTLVLADDYYFRYPRLTAPLLTRKQYKTERRRYGSQCLLNQGIICEEPCGLPLEAWFPSLRQSSCTLLMSQYVIRAVAISEAQAICSMPCTAVVQATASVPSVYECATGDPNNATLAGKAQAPELGVPSSQARLSCSAVRLVAMPSGTL